MVHVLLTLSRYTGPTFGIMSETIENICDLICSEDSQNRAAVVGPAEQLHSICPSDCAASAVAANSSVDVSHVCNDADIHRIVKQ